MGAKLVAYYQLAKETGGLPMQMRLAMKTLMPTEKATAAPDSPENLEKFYLAAKEVIGPNVPKF